MSKPNLPTRWAIYIRDQPTEILNTYDKAICLVVRIYMNNETGECFPTNIQIASGASCDVKTVRKVMRKLVKLGFLKRWKKKPKSGAGQYHYHYKALIIGEHSSSIDNIKRNDRVTNGVSEIHKEGNDIPPNYEFKYTKNLYSNNTKSESARIHGFQRVSLIKHLNELNSQATK